MEGKKIKLNRTIREQIADIIRQEIITERLKPGQQIVEREISNLLNVSTTPVKEAFRTLESEGLMISIPRRGTFVTDFAKQSIEQTNIIRSSLEGAAARIAAARMDKEQIDELEKLLKLAKGYLNAGKLEEAVKINTKFHQTIRNAGNNSFLISSIKTLKSYENTFRYKALEDPDEREKGYNEHFSILQAIKAGDLELVETLMRNHIRRSSMHVMTKKEE